MRSMLIDIKILFRSILLSILMFFVVSFLTVLISIINPKVDNSLDIGFPLIYYNRFFISDCIRFSWNGIYLVFDFIIIWVITLIIYLLLKKYKPIKR